MLNILIILVVLIIILLFIKKVELFSIEPKGINSFDKFLYINLEKRKDRKKQLLEHLKKVDISDDKIERIDAVYEKYNGHLGCCKSHIKALERAKELGVDSVVILEDDFVFTMDKDKINEKINHFLKKYPDFDVVQFNTELPKIKRYKGRTCKESK